MLAGASGILAPLVAMVFISIAILYSPGFSLTQNWLADLTGMGHEYVFNVARPLVSSPTTEILTRSGFIIAGILGIVFSLGLFYDDDAPSHRLGAVFVALGSAALGAISIFPESTGLINLVVGYAFYLLIPIAILLIGGALIGAFHNRLGGLSIALGMIALIGVSFQSYGRGVAEAIIISPIAVWDIVFGVRLLAHASHQM
jgi:hypothetical membrane protein